jgi:GNAT superfamily N-acetyltransferase
MTHYQVRVQAPVHDSFRVQQVSGMFSLPEVTQWQESFSAELPGVDEAWSIGAIVGPSGSGKSTLARTAYGAALYEPGDWPVDRAMIDGLGGSSIRQVTQVLTAVGLGSPPTWLKPYHVLSNGEKFRCELARALLQATARGPQSLVVFDEFTSVVDRRVAQVASHAMGRAIRRGHWPCRFVAVSCHSDIVSWLAPDWVLDLASVGDLAASSTSGPVGPRLTWGCLRRPQLRLRVTRCPQKLWSLFARHHYLSAGLSRAATCYAAWLDDRPVAFCALLAALGRKGHKRISRLVTLPDYQGLGIGWQLAERVADAALDDGFRVSITASHPAIIAKCRQSPNWKLKSVRPLGNLSRQSLANRTIPSSAGRGVATFEYRLDRSTFTT